MKLELKHLAVYLPYDVDCIANARAFGAGDLIKKMDCYMMMNLVNNDTTYKPILRPLSDLAKEITHKGETFVPIVKIAELFGLKVEKFEHEGNILYGWDERLHDDVQGYEFAYCDKGLFGVWFDTADASAPLYTYCSYDSIQLLLEWNFDIFGLIDAGLAVDINSLQK